MTGSVIMLARVRQDLLEVPRESWKGPSTARFFVNNRLVPARAKIQSASGWLGKIYYPSWRGLVLLRSNSYVAPPGPHIRHFPSRLLCRHWMQMVAGSTLDNFTHFSA